MLKRIYIDNYKCLVNFELRLEEITLLIGRNGAGKTAVFDSIYALRKLLDGRNRVTDADVFPPSTLTRWQSRDCQTFELDVELKGDSLTYCLEIEHYRAARKARVKRETLQGNGSPLFGFTMGDVQLYKDDHGKGPSFKGNWTESALSKVAPDDRTNKRLTRFVDFMRTVMICSLNPTSFAAEAASEDEVLARDGSNFVNWYRYWVLERQDLAQEHIEIMKEVLDDLRAWRLEKIGINTRALMSLFGNHDLQHSLTFSELSDGQRVLTVLYALISLATKPGQMLMLDEPINFVGLAEIQPWLIDLYNACESKLSQAVLASHHPEIIDYLGAEHAILLLRDGTGPTRAEPLKENIERLTGNGSLKLSEVIARGWEM